LGGLLKKGGPVMIVDKDGKERPDLLKDIVTIKGKELKGGP